MAKIKKKQIQAKKKIINKIPLDVYSTDYEKELQVDKYYTHVYNEIPFTYINQDDFEKELLLKKLFEKYSLTEKNFIHKEIRETFEDNAILSPCHYLLKICEKVWVQFRFGGYKILYSKTTKYSLVEDLILLGKSCKESKKSKGSFFMVIRDSSGFDLKEFKLKAKTVDLNLNYNDDFLPVHQIISDSLNEDGKNGIVLLHGKFGSGKTSYLRYLISNLNKKIIFFPLELMDSIASPEFLPFISDYKNSILIVEDCEELLKPRESTFIKNSGITNLLNLGDGLLADALSIKIICTFNADLKNIDQAILRKGRLIARYEFNGLNIQKAQTLSDSLGFENLISNPMTLAEIFNQEKADFSEIRQNNKVGFKVS